MSLRDDILFVLKPRCPICRQGRLFKPYSLTLVDHCASCAAPLGENDIGDGGTVFVLFILCFSIIPLAWCLELIAAPPLWLHVIVWGLVSLGLIGVLMPAVKAYIILLEYRHRSSKK